MNRKLLALPILAALVATSWLVSRSNLRTWSIPHVKETIKELYAQPRARPGQDVQRWPGGPSYVSLSRPGRDGSVAIISYEEYGQDQSAQLNPRGLTKANFDYGPIPPLADITPNQADQLWSTCNPNSNPSNDRTYKLVNADGCEYLLDLAFDRNRLQKGRLRSKGLRVEEWREVKGE